MLLVTPVGTQLAAIAAWWLRIKALPPAAQAPMLMLVLALLASSWFTLGVAFYKNTGQARRALWPLAKSLAAGCAGLVLCQALSCWPKGLLWALAEPWMQVTAPACLALGVARALSETRALMSMSHAPIKEIWRVHRAGRATSIVVLSMVSFAALNHAALTYNRKWDLTHFKRSEPGSKSRNLVKGLTSAVTVRLFFPPGNDVLEQARSYCEGLRAASAYVELDVLDQALEPTLARELKVRRNGTIALTLGKKTELIALGLDIESSRAALRRLDADVARALTQLTQADMVVYFTDGHNERVVDAPASHQAAASLQDLKALLQGQGYVLRPLGLAEGLGQHIPDDAALVAIMGPIKAFAPQELTALRAYLGRGGSLLACLDPDRDADDGALAGLMHVSVGRGRVGNAHYQVRAEGQGPSPFNIVTVRAAGHPAVQSLEAHPGRLGLILLGAAEVSALEQRAPAGAEDARVTVTPLVYAMPDSFIEGTTAADNRSPKGTRASLTSNTNPSMALASAVQWPGDLGGRAVVIGDVDLAADGVLRNVGNSYFFSDAVAWLTGRQHIAGAVESEEDVPLVHRKEADVLWFYGVSFGAPLLVLALGLAVFERDHKRLRRLLSSPQDGLKEGSHGRTHPSP